MLLWLAIRSINSAYVCVGLVIQLAKRMGNIVSCDLSDPTLFFSNYLIKCTIYENTLLNTKCVL